MPFDEPSNSARTPAEAAAGRTLDHDPESMIQSPAGIQSPATHVIVTTDPCVITVQTVPGGKKKSRVRPVTVTYGDYARLQGLSINTVRSRIRRGKLDRIDSGDRGANGKTIWLIPASELSPEALERWRAEQAAMCAAGAGADAEAPYGDVKRGEACRTAEGSLPAPAPGRPANRRTCIGAETGQPRSGAETARANAGVSRSSPSARQIRTCKGAGDGAHGDAASGPASDRGPSRALSPAPAEPGQGCSGSQAPPPGPPGASAQPTGTSPRPRGTLGAGLAGAQGNPSLADCDGRQVAVFNREEIPVLADDPRRVWEAGLVATRSRKAVETFHKRRAVIHEIEVGQAGVHHGDGLDVVRRVAADHGLSWRTVYTWLRRYRDQGEPGLVPRWRKSSGSKTIPKRLQGELEAFYAQPTRPSIAQCYRYARDWCLAHYDRTGTVIPFPSYHAVRRHIERCVERRPAMIEAGREGRKRFADRYEYVVRRAEWAMPLNDCWVLDHRCMDTHIILPSGKIGRAWLTAVCDLRSADFVGWVLRERDQVTSDAVACAMRNAILGFTIYDELGEEWIEFPARGLPKFAYIDRGMEFNAKNRGKVKRGKGGRPHSPKQLPLDPDHERTLFGTLGIKRCRAIAYRARSKPIEPWFGSFARRCENLIAGWCGHNTISKPADLEARRARGELLSWTQYLGVLARAIQQWRHERPVGERDLPPAAYWDGYQPELPNEADLDLLLLRKTCKKVRNGGITIQHGKCRPWHFLSDDPAFALLGGCELEIRWSPDHPESCIAIHPRTGQRWKLLRVDLRHESWRMMHGEGPGERQTTVMRAGKHLRAGVAAYQRWAADQLDPELADPYGTLRAAADNGRDIRGIRREIERDRAAAERPPARRDDTPPADERAGGDPHRNDYLRALARREREEEATIEALGDSSDG